MSMRPNADWRRPHLVLYGLDGKPKRPRLSSFVVMTEYAWDMVEPLRRLVPDFVAGMPDALIVEGLVSCGPPADDGYAYAKQLERGGWSDLTAEVVAVLERATRAVLEAFVLIEAEWVALHGLTLTLPEGTVVQVGEEFGQAHTTDPGRQHAHYLFQPNGAEAGEARYVPFESVAPLERRTPV